MPPFRKMKYDASCRVLDPETSVVSHDEGGVEQGSNRSSHKYAQYSPIIVLQAHN